MTVFGQEDLNRLLWDSQYLIHLHGGEQGEKDYVTKFWDLKSGERYTAYETVRRYDKLQRDLETITLEDMERGMNQACLTLVEKLGAAILENGPIDKKSKTLVEAQGPPMPVLRRLHLSTWRHGGDVFPRMDFDALAPIGFGDGRKAIVVGEGTLYATRRDVMNLAIRVATLQARLRARDPLLTAPSPSSKVHDKEPYWEFAIHNCHPADLRLIPLMLAWNYDPVVKTYALENRVALLSWRGGAVDVVVPPYFKS